MTEERSIPPSSDDLGPPSDRRGLAGVRVLVTRATHQSSDLSQLLVSRGARTVEIPVIQIEDADDMNAVRRAASWQTPYDVLIFTSANGVRRFHATARDAGRALKTASPLIVAIGTATADAARTLGFKNVQVPAEHRGEAIYSLLHERFVDTLATKRVLLARAQLARDALPNLLQSQGVQLDIVAVYKTTPVAGTVRDELVRTIVERAVDVVTLTSSSTAENVMQALGTHGAEQLAGLRVASIGPITTETARALGIRVDVEARAYTALGLVDALEKYWQARDRKP